MRTARFPVAAASIDRRQMLRYMTVAGTGLAALGAARSVRAQPAAPAWPKDAFAQKDEADALKTLYGKPADASDKVSIDVPEIAENGAVVPVSVSTTLPDVSAISIFIPENPFALTASYQIPAGTDPSVACRLKMAKTSDVVVVVASAGKLYSAKKQVKVTLGGCGG